MYLNNSEYVLSVVVINSGMGSQVLAEAKRIGVPQGTIFLGRGTVKSHFLRFLGLYETQKEIVFMVTERHLEQQIHNVLVQKFCMNKPNHGIIFSSPVKRVLGITKDIISDSKQKNGGSAHMGYEVIFTIVERGLGEDVVDAAIAAGANGATIINARGSGVHEREKFFAMEIEPEKEIVMIIVNRDKTEGIVSSINETMDIEKPGKGVIFVMDVSKTSGLVG